MSTIAAIGIVVGIILVFYVAPYWLFKGFEGNDSNSAAWKLTKGFVIELSMGILCTLMIVIYYCIIRLLLGKIIHPLGSGSPKEYGIIALCIFSWFAFNAIYSSIFTIVMIIKHPGFKDYYLNKTSPFNMNKGDVKDYQNKKRSWGIIYKVLPRKQKHLIYSYFYNVLGLDTSASTDEVRKAYREKAQQFHPDKFFNASNQEKETAEKKFREIKDAYEHIMKLKKKI